MRAFVFIALIFGSLAGFANDEVTTKKSFPGSRDEDPIKVREELPDIEIKTDRKSLETKFRSELFKSKEANPTETQQ